MELTDALDRTFRHAHGVIAGVRPDQLGLPTPCTEWTVRDLLEHTIGVVARFGGDPRFELGADPAGQFRDAADAALAAWRAPGAMDRTAELPAGSMPGRMLANINLLDTATHAWDIARATGQPAELPPDVAAAALAASEQIVTPQLRHGRFGPPVAVADDAPASDRLVAFLGRTP